MKYILLNALIPQDFGLTVEEMAEAATEWGCTFEMSEGLRDPGSRPLTQKYYYLTSTSLDALKQCIENVDLTGNIVEVTAIYDQFTTEELIVKK